MINRQAQIVIDSLSARMHEFFDWWTNELWMLLPESVRNLVNLEHEHWIVEVDDTDVLIYRESDNNESTGPRLRFAAENPSENIRATLRHLGTNRDQSIELVAHLAPHCVLRKELFLPLAAEENLRGVLGYGMDQETPFKAEQVYYDHRVLERQVNNKRLRVELVAVLRSTLDQALDKLARLDLYPDAVRIAGSDRASGAINLLPTSRQREAPPTWNRLNLALTVIMGVLLIAAIAWPLVQKRQAIADLEQHITEVKKKALAVDQLRIQIEGLAKDSRFLIAKKKTNPIIIAVLDELTRVLPDDTWLYQFELNGKEITIQGESTSSSAIIGVIETAKLFQNASFRSPVTQNRVTSAERFNLTAEVVTETGS